MKRVDIYGSLQDPLEIGHAAIIKEKTQTRQTSAVQHFIVHPSGLIFIQTKNTYYYLHPLSDIPTATVEQGRD